LKGEKNGSKNIKNTMVDPIEKTCKNCGSIFTFNYEDIQRKERDSFIGYTMTDIYVVCPVCKKSLSIDTDKDCKPKSGSSLKELAKVVDEAIDEA